MIITGNKTAYLCRGEFMKTNPIKLYIINAMDKKKRKSLEDYIFLLELKKKEFIPPLFVC